MISQSYVQHSSLMSMKELVMGNTLSQFSTLSCRVGALQISIIIIINVSSS